VALLDLAPLLGQKVFKEILPSNKGLRARERVSLCLTVHMCTALKATGLLSSLQVKLTSLEMN